MSEETKKRKFNIIDLIVIIIIVAAIALVAWKFVGNKQAEELASTQLYDVTFTTDELSTDVAQKVVDGDKVLLFDDDSDFGVVVGTPIIEDARSYSNDSEGNITVGPKDGYSKLTITVQVQADSVGDNFINVASNKYSLNQSVTLRVGMVKIFNMRIVDIAESK